MHEETVETKVSSSNAHKKSFYVWFRGEEVVCLVSSWAGLEIFWSLITTFSAHRLPYLTVGNVLVGFPQCSCSISSSQPFLDPCARPRFSLLLLPLLQNRRLLFTIRAQLQVVERGIFCCPES